MNININKNNEKTGFYETLEDNFNKSSEIIQNNEEMTNIRLKIMETIKKYNIELVNQPNNDDEQIRDKIKLLNRLYKFPYYDHLENYLLFKDFLSDNDLNNLISSLNINIPLNNIHFRKLFVLLVCYSREIPEYILRKNSSKTLYLNLKNLTKDAKNFDSTNISNIIKSFITNIDIKMINNIINGAFMVEIYKKNYKNILKNDLSDILIQNLTKKWLNDESIVDFPISYIFNPLNETNNDVDVCSSIIRLFKKKNSILKDFVMQGYEPSAILEENKIKHDNTNNKRKSKNK
jgi:hypothetical protein